LFPGARYVHTGQGIRLNLQFTYGPIQVQTCICM